MFIVSGYKLKIARSMDGVHVYSNRADREGYSYDGGGSAVAMQLYCRSYGAGLCDQ